MGMFRGEEKASFYLLVESYSANGRTCGGGSLQSRRNAEYHELTHPSRQRQLSIRWSFQKRSSVSSLGCFAERNAPDGFIQGNENILPRGHAHADLKTLPCFTFQLEFAELICHRLCQRVSTVENAHGNSLNSLCVVAGIHHLADQRHAIRLRTRSQLEINHYIISFINEMSGARLAAADAFENRLAEAVKN